MAEPYHLPDSPSDALERIGTALAHPIRQTILIRLTDGPASPSELARLCHTTRPNLSNHLSCLRGCGLVEFERHGRRLSYRLASEELGTALHMLRDVVDETCELHR